VAEVRWTGPALRDLRSIRDFIARDSRQYARTTVERISTSIKDLELFSESGRVVPELSGGQYRERIISPYRAIYRYSLTEDVAFVVAIVHGSRLLPPISG